MHFIHLCLFRNFYWISKLLLDYLLNIFFKTCSLFFWAHLFYLKTKKSLQSIKHLYLLLLPSPYPMAYTLLANSLQRLQAVALSSIKSADEANEEICEPILQMKHFNEAFWKRLTKTHYASDCIQSFKGIASRGTTIQNNNKVVLSSLIQSICGITWRKYYHCNLLLANTSFCNFSGKSLLTKNPEPIHWKPLPHSSNIKSKGNSQLTFS